MNSDQIMMYISSDDLQFHFGVDHPEKVDPESYQVIRIVNPLRPVRHHPRGHLLGKRSGEDTKDLTHNLQVKAFGKKYEVCNIALLSKSKCALCLRPFSGRNFHAVGTQRINTVRKGME